MNEPNGGDIATGLGAGMDDDSVEIRLDDIERRVEIAAFLASLASVNLIVWAIVLVVAAVMPDDNPARLYLLTSAPAAIWFFFLWSCAAAQACARTLGIHPICRWLPKRRRLATTLLFMSPLRSLEISVNLWQRQIDS